MSDSDDKPIVSLAEFHNNGKLDTPKRLLEDALKRVDQEDNIIGRSKKLLILAIDEDEGDYDVGFMQAGMKMSECIALMRVAEQIFLEQMNYTTSQNKVHEIIDGWED